MAEETRTVAVVDEICAQTVLDADAVFRLRNAVRKSTNERKALQGRLAALDSENLSKEEKSLRAGAFNWLLGRSEEAAEAVKGLSSQAARAVRGAVALEKPRATVPFALAGPESTTVVLPAGSLNRKSASVPPSLAGSHTGGGAMGPE